MRKDQSHDPFELSTGRYADFFAPQSREDLEFRLTRKLVLTARRWTQVSEERIRAATGQSRARWQTLLALAFADAAITTTTLSARLGMAWPPLIRTLNALEADGLIRRDEHPQDKRSRTIDVTEEGYRVIEAVKPILAQVRRETLALVDDSQLQLATDLLDAVLAGATRAAGADGRG